MENWGAGGLEWSVLKDIAGWHPLKKKLEHFVAMPRDRYIRKSLHFKTTKQWICNTFTNRKCVKHPLI